MARSNYIGSGRKYVRYTDEQIRRVRQTDMLDFLGRYEGLTFRRTGKVYTCVQHDSLIVQADRQRWFWNSRTSETNKEAQGLNVLDYLEKFKGYSWQEAMAFMLGEGKDVARSNVDTAALSKKEEKKEFEKPEKDTGQYKQVFAYLTKTRCIDPSVVSYCVKHDLIYQEKKFKGGKFVGYNAVFAGYDENGEMKFAECKVTNQYAKQFNINVTGSDKQYSFNITNRTADTDRSTVFVFEAPVDLLSHATMYVLAEKKKAAAEDREPNTDIWLKQNRLSLSGRSMWVLEKYLERNSDIKNIVLCLDNDYWGQKSCAEMQEQLGGRYNVTVHHAKYGKDYNECLQHFVKGSLPPPKEEKLSHDTIQKTVSHDTKKEGSDTTDKPLNSTKVEGLRFIHNDHYSGFAELDGKRIAKFMPDRTQYRVITFENGYSQSDDYVNNFNEVVSKAEKHALHLKGIDNEEFDLTQQANKGRS